MAEKDKDQPERYVDPNSGAAPQPGGMVSPGAAVGGENTGNGPDDTAKSQGGLSEEGAAPTSNKGPRASDKTDKQSDLGSNVDDVEEPAGNASQEEWAQYAVDHKGADPDEVAEMGRNELRDTYGSK
jgi:hypothetical protein